MSDLSHHDGMLDRIEELEAQRDELLEALKEARPYVPDHHGPISHKIDAAIAKAKENT